LGTGARVKSFVAGIKRPTVLVHRLNRKHELNRSVRRTPLRRRNDLEGEFEDAPEDGLEEWMTAAGEAPATPLQG
jgi:hypothetical protein